MIREYKTTPAEVRQLRALCRRRTHWCEKVCRTQPVAVANSLLQAVWFILTHRPSYGHLGGDPFEQLHREKTTQTLVRRLQRIGYRITLESAA